MRLTRLVITAGLGGLLAVGFAAPSQAALTTYCNGVAADVSIPGHLIVRAGDSCDLTNVTINGNTTVEEDATLILTDSSAAGGLSVHANGFASLDQTEIEGTTELTGAFGVYSEDSSHGLDVSAEDADFYYTLHSSHGAGVTATNVETFLESSTVASDVTAAGGLLTDLYDSVVEGSLSVSDTEVGSVVCLSEIDGAATFSGNAGLLQIGADQPVSDCGFNVFGDDVTVTGNSANPIVIADNVIRGDLTCADNDVTPRVSGNRIRGEENCGRGPVGALSAQSRVALSSARDIEERKAEVLDEIEARTAEGEEAAEDSGYAFD